MARWVIEGILARSARPGYPSRGVSVDEMDRWAEEVRGMGIRSIICLLKEELGYYAQLPGGLLEWYRKMGFTVESIPITDPAHDQRGWEELENNLEPIYQKFLQLPKPVLVHCSFGKDRTGPAVDHISRRWRGESRDTV